jgi:hypothetical protein
MATKRVGAIAATNFSAKNDKSGIERVIDATQQTRVKKNRYNRPKADENSVVKQVGTVDVEVMAVVAEDGHLALKREERRKPLGIARWSQYYEDLAKTK